MHIKGAMTFSIMTLSIMTLSIVSSSLLNMVLDTIYKKFYSAKVSSLFKSFKVKIEIIKYLNKTYIGWISLFNSATALSIMTLSITTHSFTTLSIMTLTIMLMPSVVMTSIFYAEYHK
jgi:hypothetical protein